MLLLIGLAILFVLIIIFKDSKPKADKQPEYFEPSVDMVEFRSDDPKQKKYTRHWDRDEWGLDSSERYYENLNYYQSGLSDTDPQGEIAFDDPAGNPPLPGMSEGERLNQEVTELYQRAGMYQEDPEKPYFRGLTTGSSIEYSS